MKPCPHCQQSVPEDQTLCMYCRRFIPPASAAQESTLQWYFRTHWLIILFLSVGPLMVPLIIIHPRLSLKKKVIITVVITLLSLVVGMVFAWAVKSLFSYYQLIMKYL